MDGADLMKRLGDFAAIAKEVAMIGLGLLFVTGSFLLQAIVRLAIALAIVGLLAYILAHLEYANMYY